MGRQASRAPLRCRVSRRLRAAQQRVQLRVRQQLLHVLAQAGRNHGDAALNRGPDRCDVLLGGDTVDDKHLCQQRVVVCNRLFLRALI